MHSVMHFLLLLGMGRAEILQAKKHYIKLMEENIFFCGQLQRCYQKYTEFELERDRMGGVAEVGLWPLRLVLACSS